MIVLHCSFCFVLVVVFHVASGAFLWFVRFWRTRERLCVNRIRPLLSMRGMLLVSNPGLIAACLLQRARLKSSSTPSLSMSRNPDVAWLKEMGQNWTSSVMTIGLSINGCTHSKKTIWRERTRLTNQEVRAAATSKVWRDSGRACFSSSHSRRQKEAPLAGWKFWINLGFWETARLPLP